jgi:predicted dehydrogenase
VLTPTADIANARLEFASGLIANLTASRISRDRMRKMRVFQPDAYLSLDFLTQRLEVYRRRQGTADVAAALAAALAAAPAGASRSPGGAAVDPADFIEYELVAPPPEDHLRAELAAFVAAVQRGGPAPVTGEDGRRALALAERITVEMDRRAASRGAGARGGAGSPGGGRAR